MLGTTTNIKSLTTSVSANGISVGDTIEGRDLKRSRQVASKVTHVHTFEWNKAATIELVNNNTLTVFQGQPLYGKKPGSDDILLAVDTTLCTSEFYMHSTTLEVGDSLKTLQGYIEVINITPSNNSLTTFQRIYIDRDDKFIVGGDDDLLIPTGEIIEEFKDDSFPMFSSVGRGNFSDQIGSLSVNRPYRSPGFLQLAEFRKEYLSLNTNITDNYRSWLTAGFIEGKDFAGDIDVTLTNPNGIANETELGEFLYDAMNIGFNQMASKVDVVYADYNDAGGRC